MRRALTAGTRITVDGRVHTWPWDGQTDQPDRDADYMVEWSPQMAVVKRGKINRYLVANLFTRRAAWIDAQRVAIVW